ncbi:MAG: preQ(1) synthase [Syntrophaceticus schinkii]|jgi:7-cyano-7-deazaguanine reductase
MNQEKEKDLMRWDMDTYEAIATEVLEAIPFEYPGSDTEVAYVYPEFTSVCPWTGLPDFGELTISYVPREKLVELKSLKYYLNSFRNVGILQEHVVSRVKEDLVQLLNPVSLTVKADFRPRGGIGTQVQADFRS